MDSHGTASEVKISVGDNSMSSKRGPLLSLPLESTTTRSRGEACKSGQGTAINLMPFTLGSLNSISSSADNAPIASILAVNRGASAIAVPLPTSMA